MPASEQETLKNNIRIDALIDFSNVFSWHMAPSGYNGTLCMRCSEQYYASSGACVECKGVGLPPLMVKALAFVPQQHGLGIVEEMCFQF